MKLIFRYQRIWLFLVILVFVLAACRKDDNLEVPAIAKSANKYSGDNIQKYFSLLCDISQTTPGFFPPQVARAYGYIGVTNYEAVVNGIDGAQSLKGQLNELSASALPNIEKGKGYNWGITSNAATADMMRKMFETKITAYNSSRIDSMENANLLQLSTNEIPDVITRSVQYGKAISSAIYQYSTTDGGDKSYIDPFQLPYNLPTDPFCWVPTGAALHPISPRWGDNRPFLQVDITNTQPAAPIEFSTSASSPFYKEAMDVYNQSKNNTMDQKEITEYWADDPFNTYPYRTHI